MKTAILPVVTAVNGRADPAAAPFPHYAPLRKAMVRAIRTATLHPKARGLGMAFAMAMLLLASFSAAAQRVEGDRVKAEGLYAAEVSVNGQGETERNTAFARGLAQVLGRLTGDRGAASKPGVGQELRRAR